MAWDVPWRGGAANCLAYLAGENIAEGDAMSHFHAEYTIDVARDRAADNDGICDFGQVLDGNDSQ